MTLAEVRASKETHAMYRPGVEGRTILKGEKPFFIPGCKSLLGHQKVLSHFWGQPQATIRGTDQAVDTSALAWDLYYKVNSTYPGYLPVIWIH